MQRRLAINLPDIEKLEGFEATLRETSIKTEGGDWS